MSDQKHVPSLILRSIDSEKIGIRFIDIGRRQRFEAILRRLQADFPLSKCEEIDSQPWWIVTPGQSDEVEEFAKRNGLRLIRMQ